MRTRVALVLAVVILGAGCGGTRIVVRTVTAPANSGDQRFFGRIVSLRPVGNHYELRFDPAWFLSGVTANVAQAEDSGTHCRPAACPPVPNDNYTLDEGHRLLTFLVPAATRGTVLAKHGSGPFPATRIAAPELARIVAGTSSLKLFEPLSSGVWIVVHIDTVRSFSQQYRP